MPTAWGVIAVFRSSGLPEPVYAAFSNVMLWQVDSLKAEDYTAHLLNEVVARTDGLVFEVPPQLPDGRDTFDVLQADAADVALGLEAIRFIADSHINADSSDIDPQGADGTLLRDLLALDLERIGRPKP